MFSLSFSAASIARRTFLHARHRTFAINHLKWQQRSQFSSFLDGNNNNNNNKKYTFRDRQELTNGFRHLKSPLALKIMGGLGLGLLIFYTSNQRYVEISGDHRFIVVPDAKEDEMGKSAFNQILRSFKGKVVSQNSPYYQRVYFILYR